MNRPSSKLPSWQARGSSPYLRRGVLKSYRTIIFLILFVYCWRRYSPSFVPGFANNNEIVEPNTSDLENIGPHPLLKVRNTVNEIAPIYQSPGGRKERRQDFEKASRSTFKQVKEGSISLPEETRNEVPEVNDLPEVVLANRKSGDSPENIHGQSQVLVVKSPESEELKAEPEDDEPLDKPPSTAKGKVKSDTESTVDNDYHSLPVLEASQRVIEQPSPLAVKAGFEEVGTKISQDPANSLRFPDYFEYQELAEKAESLPDIVHITFEDATEDITLTGWEDAWFSDVEFDVQKWGNLSESKIDFVYTWVNGSEEAFQDTILPYELNSTLNDPEGVWLESHRVNRYRDWDELRYSMRSVEKYAGTFRNKIQLLVNAVADPNESANATVESPASIIGKQIPQWLKSDQATQEVVQILSQEDFFDERQQGCLPTFNSLTIEGQIFNTKSDTDQIFALSDDMLLGKVHAASDIHSPLFGPTMGFKSNSYNTINPPTDLDARRFGEKPFLIYTSWLLNRRFGARKRKGQVHFGHSLSRSVMREAFQSFPRPAHQSTCQRFRGEIGFQIYSWYVTFHYTMERHREVLLWSYIMHRSDIDNNGNLDWSERYTIMKDLEEGMENEGKATFRKRMFYNMNEALEAAGLEAPKVNVDVQWTSLDGPAAIKDIDCLEFNVNECLAPGFSSPSSDTGYVNHVFSTASIFDRLARQQPKCGDCFLKLILNRVEKGFSPLLPHADKQSEARKVVVKALWKYQYVIVEPDAYFVMIMDAEQVENVLFKRLLKRKGKVGQLCLNDDVSSEDPEVIADVRKVMIRLLEAMVPETGPFEKEREKKGPRRKGKSNMEY